MRKGFSLIEVIACTLVVGVLASGLVIFAQSYYLASGDTRSGNVARNNYQAITEDIKVTAMEATSDGEKTLGDGSKAKWKVAKHEGDNKNGMKAIEVAIYDPSGQLAWSSTIYKANVRSPILTASSTGASTSFTSSWTVPAPPLGGGGGNGCGG